MSKGLTPEAVDVETLESTNSLHHLKTKSIIIYYLLSVYMFDSLFQFDITDLDEYNFRSDVRDLGRRYRDDELEDNREIHDFIAHYANLLLQDTIVYEGKVTTTYHSEKVIVTHPYDRNSAYDNSFLLTLRRNVPPAGPGEGREFVNEFRDELAGYICQVAQEACEIADHHHMTQAESGTSV